MAKPRTLPPAYDEDGKPICGIPVNTPYGRCRRPPVKGRNRCKRHGGGTPRGFAHPAFKTGANSEHMPPSYREDYERALNDPDLLSLKSQIAAVDARLMHLYRELGSGEAANAWRELSRIYDDMAKAQRAGHTDQARSMLTDIGRLIRSGASDAAMWEELGRNIDRLARLKELETRRMLTMSLMVTPEKMDVVVSVFVRAITENVKDRKALAGIAKAIEPYIGAPTPQATPETVDAEYREL